MERSGGKGKTGQKRLTTWEMGGADCSASMKKGGEQYGKHPNLPLLAFQRDQQKG